VTDGDSLELTLERLERAGGNVAGIVLNDVRLPKQYAAYGYTYAQ
jgi:Mrp family chromosome partitioning ATPase